MKKCVINYHRLESGLVLNQALHRKLTSEPFFTNNSPYLTVVKQPTTKTTKLMLSVLEKMLSRILTFPLQCRRTQRHS